MKILVKFFASYRETVGNSYEEFDVPVNATISNVIKTITEKYPKLGTMKEALYILNQTVVDVNTKVKESDTLAVFPPVGGG